MRFRRPLVSPVTYEAFGLLAPVAEKGATVDKRELLHR
jgi:hypothetical protein